MRFFILFNIQDIHFFLILMRRKTMQCDSEILFDLLLGQPFVGQLSYYLFIKLYCCATKHSLFWSSDFKKTHLNSQNCRSVFFFFKKTLDVIKNMYKSYNPQSLVEKYLFSKKKLTMLYEIMAQYL